jgi:hypothetical protein
MPLPGLTVKSTTKVREVVGVEHEVFVKLDKVLFRECFGQF